MCDVVAKGRVAYTLPGPCKRSRRLNGGGCECDGPCIIAKARGGKGCRMCDAGKFHHTIFAAQKGQKQLENVSDRDRKLTDAQKKNQEAAAKKN